MRRLFFIFFLCFGLTAFAQDASTGVLAKKLVEGSPWRLTTPYENTVRHFRFASDGKVQVMMTNKPDVWEEFVIAEGQTNTYPTGRGNTITFHLDVDGNPTATHSKHPAQFRSIKN